MYTDTVTLSYVGAVVGLEQTFFSVSEDVGVVELCANVSFPVIDCPIKFPFEVNSPLVMELQVLLVSLYA